MQHAREQGVRLGGPADVDDPGASKFVAEDVGFFLRAVGAFEIAFMRGVKNSGIRSHDVRSQHLTAIKIAEIQPEIFRDERSLAYQSAQQAAGQVVGPRSRSGPFVCGRAHRELNEFAPLIP